MTSKFSFSKNALCSFESRDFRDSSWLEEKIQYLLNVAEQLEDFRRAVLSGNLASKSGNLAVNGADTYRHGGLSVAGQRISTERFQRQEGQLRVGVPSRQGGVSPTLNQGLRPVSLDDVLRLRGGAPGTEPKKIKTGNGDEVRNPQAESGESCESSSESPDQRSRKPVTVAVDVDEEEEEDMEVSASGEGWMEVQKKEKKAKEKADKTDKEKKLRKPDGKAELVVCIDRVDKKKFVGRLAMMKELQRIAPGVRTTALTMMERGGISLVCSNEEDLKKIYSSKFWWREDGSVKEEEAAFGKEAFAHGPRSVSGKTPGEMYIEPRKAIIEGLPSETTEEDLKTEIGHLGAIRAVQFGSKRPGANDWLVEFKAQEQADHVLANKVLFYGGLFRCRPCKNTRGRTRCGRCQEYGHASATCNAEPICSECGQPGTYGHEGCPCPKAGDPGKVCVHCFKANLPHDHSTGFGGCHFAKEDRKLAYSEALKSRKDEEVKKKAEKERKAAREQQLRQNKEDRAKAFGEMRGFSEKDFDAAVEKSVGGLLGSCVVSIIEALIVCFNMRADTSTSGLADLVVSSFERTFPELSLDYLRQKYQANVR